MKSAEEISLETKARKSLTLDDNVFETVKYIVQKLENIDDRLDQMHTNENLESILEKTENNLRKCNEMINEVKGVVSMAARASIVERKDCDVMKFNNKCSQKKCCNVKLFEKPKKWWQFWK